MARLPLAQLCRSALRQHHQHRRSAATAASAGMPSMLSGGGGGPRFSDLRRRFFQSQSGLPALPVPPLESTLEKYMRTIQPIATEEELAQVRLLVSDFRSSGVGEKLQQLLLAHANGKDNWLTDWWVNTAYLEYRESVVINVNPGCLLPGRAFTDRADWLAHCARTALGLAEFQRRLAAGALPVERLREAPLDMSQYRQILGTCRLVRPGDRDAQLGWDGRPSGHMAVAYGNQFYRVQLLRGDDDWEPLPLADVLGQLVDIVEGHPDREFAAPPAGVGILSAMHRDRWAEAKARLVAADPGNAAAMGELERSAFVMCLDRPLLRGDEWATAGQAERDAEACGNMLHGWGLAAGGNSGNRFFDKTLQVIVSEDGVCGFHYEHSPAEAVAAIRIFDFLTDWLASPDGGGGSAMSIPSSLRRVPCRQLDFVPYAGMEMDLAEAETGLQTHIDNLQITCLEFDAYGKEFVKSQCRLSPDAFFQVALQLAYYRLYQQHCATYESGSLRRFRLGRTDTIRSCTPESARFCLLMSQDESQAAAHAFRDACKAHSLLSAQAVSGQAIDRHLLGLRLIAKQHGLPQHPLFDSPVYRRAIHFQLSTSQVPSETGAVMGFGPVVPDGYGVCYNQMDDRFRVCLTAYRDKRGTDSDRLGASLRDSLLDVRDLLMLHSDRPAKL